MTSRPRPQLPDPDALARALTSLVDRRPELLRAFGFRLSVQRTMVLLLAFHRPIHAADVKAAVRSLRGTALYADLGNLRYRLPAYHCMTRLARRGGLERVRARPGQFRLARSVRQTLARALAHGSDAAGRTVAHAAARSPSIAS